MVCCSCPISHKTKLRKGNVFTPVCDSVGGRGVHHPLGRHPPPQADTHKPRQTSSRDGHCIERYASYWNAFLPPANEVCKGYVFTCVCHSVHGGGWYPSMHHRSHDQTIEAAALVISLSWWQDSIQVTSNVWWDRSLGTPPPGQTPTPPGQTPPRQTPPGSRHPSWADTPPHPPSRCAGSPTPQIWSMSGRYASYWNAFLLFQFAIHVEWRCW